MTLSSCKDRVGCLVSDVIAFDLIVLGRQLAKIGDSVSHARKRDEAADADGCWPRPERTSSRTQIARSATSPPTLRCNRATSLRPSPSSSSKDWSNPRAIRPTSAGRSFVSHPRNVGRVSQGVGRRCAYRALDGMSPDAVREVINTLEQLASWLRPTEPSPILEQLNRARDEPVDSADDR